MLRMGRAGDRLGCPVLWQIRRAFPGLSTRPAAALQVADSKAFFAPSAESPSDPPYFVA